ncbi:MAG: NADPH-dependent FMN reductase [Aquabacterium sp.]
MTTMNLIGLCGSLRAASYNRMALNLAAASLPDGATLTIADWRAVPVYDGDVEAQGRPAAVQALREQLRGADGLVVCTPEYNHSLPGGLKNVLDWVTRGADQPLAGMPAAILSASGGPLGGARVQYDLRRTLTATGLLVMAKPEVFIGNAQTKFDAAGACTDEATRGFVVAQMAAFAKWVRGVQAMRAVA